MRPLFSFKKNRIRTSLQIIRTLIVLIIAGVAVLAGLGIAAIKGWEYSNSNAFCAQACHNVHPEEPVAFQDSYHARIKCVECHMGRQETLKLMVKKAGHLKHIPVVLFKTYGRPVHSETLTSSAESCEHCHYPLSTHNAAFREFTQYLPDRDNTEKHTYLIVKIGGGGRRKGSSGGVHWHITNNVEFITTDEEHRQDIPWVRVVMRSGRVIEYADSNNPLPAEDIENGEKRAMDCLDCHNRIGHPFPAPEKAVDEALADGRLSSKLPYIKKELIELLETDYNNREEALASVQAFETRYREKYPQAAAVLFDEIGKARELSRKLITRLVFEKPGITWRSFPDNSGHRYFKGCFRCHDGQHVSKDGEVIKFQCDLCHSEPATVGKTGLPAGLQIALPSKPESHLKPGFIFNHRILAGEDCTACHGKLTYGADDSGFCASAACHGREWVPFKSYDSAGHPFPLHDEHSKPLCYQCHRGKEKPSNRCSGCHSPPKNHFAFACDNCHSPEGWKQSTESLVARAAKISHPLNMGDCLMCHDPGGEIMPAPDDHRAYNRVQCLICHRSVKGA